jgi:hypothetical protein
MRKRTTDSKVLKTMGGRAGPRSSALCLCLLVAGAAVAMALGGVATPAYALDGKSGEFEDFEGIFRPACLDLRDETGLTGGDEIFACDADGEQCHLVSTTTTTTVDQGIALGFCDDEIETVIPVRAGDIHPEVSIKATTFSTVIGVVEDPTAPLNTQIPGDIFCETSGKDSPDGSPGKKVCVHIFKGTGDCTANCPPSSPPQPLTVKRDGNDCETVKALLRASVTNDSAINLRWWLFSDSEATAEPNSEVLSVCPGFAWRFLPLNRGQIMPPGNGIAVKYQVSREEIETPHYVTISGRRICKKVAGEIPTHACP